MKQRHQSSFSSSGVDELTRLRAVDPRTGEPLAPALPLFEATRLSPKVSTNEEGPTRSTGEFKPNRGACGTSELTVPWQKNAPEALWRRAASRWFARLRVVPPRTWALWFAALLSLLGFAALPAAARPKRLPFEAESRGTATTDGAIPPLPVATQTSEIQNGQTAAQPLPLERAVSAVAEGRFEDALQLYEERHRAAPDDAATAAVLSILRNVAQGEGRREP